jgi:hypothetical protein
MPYVVYLTSNGIELQSVKVEIGLSTIYNGKKADEAQAVLSLYQAFSNFVSYISCDNRG